MCDFIDDDDESDAKNRLNTVDTGSSTYNCTAPTLQIQPVYTISTWKPSRTRDRLVIIILLISAGSIERLNNVHAEVENGLHVRVDIHWPPVLTDTDFITHIMNDDKN